MPTSTIPAFLLAKGLAATASRFVDGMFDDTFKGIHRLEFFDYAILIPYFTVLIVLSCYGLHRFHMIRGYWKYRRRMPVDAPVRFERLPQVTIQLPIYNEQYVVCLLYTSPSPRDS